MIDAMQLRGFFLRTHECYLRAVCDLAKHYSQSPSSCRQSLSAIRFLYLQVLHREAFEVGLVTPKRPQRIPKLLTVGEVARIVAECKKLRDRTLLQTCYGCGLRVSELVALKVRHNDGEPKLLRIEQAKGAKDRYIHLSDRLLAHLRAYWQTCRPREWLFVSQL